MTRPNAILIMHFVALLWGAAGVLGATTSADSFVITFGRTVFAILALGLWPRVRREVRDLDRFVFLKAVLIGTLLGAHWIAFFQAIKTGGVALALVTYATTPTIIALFEVMLRMTPTDARIFLAALLSFAGVMILHPLENSTKLLDPGFAWGMFSALTISVMTILVKRSLRGTIDVLPLTVGQLVGAAGVSIVFAAPSLSSGVSAHDLVNILLLGVMCSAVGQTLFNRCLSSVTAGTAAVIASMEAPYGILLAAVLVDEPLTIRVISGVALVCIAAVTVSLPRRASAK